MNLQTPIPTIHPAFLPPAPLPARASPTLAPATRTCPRILFVRSGGGLPGLDIHAGIWLALEERGIIPTEVHGTSAGAIASAIQASGKSAVLGAALVNSLRDSDVRRELFAWKIRIPWIDHFIDNGPILAIMQNIMAPTFDKLTMPMQCWATRRETGHAINVANPDLSPTPALAAMASSSISGCFPAVKLLDGYTYVDGGVRCNLPLPRNWRDFDKVYLLIASGRPADYPKTKGLLTAVYRNLQYLMRDQVADVLDIVGNAPNVHVIWPQVRSTGGMLHFDHSLLHESYRQARAALDKHEVSL
jgi:predicted acylesterase/phospholipase RssA